MPQSRKVVREYIALAGLPDIVMTALAQGRGVARSAAAILSVADGDREWFWREAVEALHLSASETRLVAGGATDLAAREGRGMREVVAEILAEAKGRVRQEGRWRGQGAVQIDTCAPAFADA